MLIGITVIVQYLSFMPVVSVLSDQSCHRQINKPIKNKDSNVFKKWYVEMSIQPQILTICAHKSIASTLFSEKHSFTINPTANHPKHN